MSSVLFRTRTPGVDALIEQRRRTGIDRFDEVWEGVYVVNPAPNLDHALLARRIAALFAPGAEARGLDVVENANVGLPDDYRIPDVVVFDPADADEARLYLRTAPLVVEVLSPNERVDKQPFYLAHGVSEVVLVDPVAGTVVWFAATAGAAAYRAVEVSAVLPLGVADVVALLEG